MKKIISEVGDRGVALSQKGKATSGGQSSSDFAKIDPRRVDSIKNKTVSQKTNSGPHKINRSQEKASTPATGPVDDIDGKEVEAPVNAPEVKQPSQEVINAITQDQIQRILKLAGQAEMPKVIDDDESVRSNFHYDHAPEKRETEKQNIDLEIPLSKVELPIAKVGQVIAGDDDANAEWERLHPSNESLDRIKKLSGLK
jgi:hypothetical protein